MTTNSNTPVSTNNDDENNNNNNNNKVEAKQIIVSEFILKNRNIGPNNAYTIAQKLKVILNYNITIASLMLLFLFLQ